MIDAENGDTDPFAGPSWSRQRDRLGRVRVRVRRKHKPRWRRWALLGSGALLLLLVGAAAWLLHDGLSARSELADVRTEVQTLRKQVSAGELVAARSTARSLQGHAAAAYGDVSSTVWGIGEHLPWVGDPLHDAHELTSVVNSLAGHALPQLIDAAGVVDPSSLRGATGSIDVAAIRRVAPSLSAAQRTMTAAMTALTRMPKSSWSSINAARSELIAQLPALTKTVADAGLAARLAPALLGADGPKNYMITFQNDAEMRATGGLPGAFAILHVADGKLSFTHFESDGYLVGTSADGVHFGGDYDALYGTGSNGARSDYRNSNLSPHYPYAAQIWLGMWLHKTGEHLDGALTLDPTALSYLLQASGPARLADGTVVSSANVVALTQSTVYARFTAGDNASRKQYLLDIAEAVSHKLLGTGVDSAALIRAAAHAANEGRLLFWVSDPTTEASIAALPLGGVEPVTAAPYFRLALWNSTGSKIDYYLHTSLEWMSTGCGAKRQVTVTVGITNSAPAGLPPYVLGATIDKQFGIPPGDEYIAIMAYGTQDSYLSTYTVDGKPVDVGQFLERGHPVWSDGEYVPRGKTITVVYHLSETSSTLAPIVPAQPMVNPMSVTVHQAAC